jgi:hypothetical protein
VVTGGSCACLSLLCPATSCLHFRKTVIDWHSSWRRLPPGLPQNAANNFKFSNLKRQFNGAESRLPYSVLGFQFPHAGPQTQEGISSVVESSGGLDRTVTPPGLPGIRGETFWRVEKPMRMSVEGMRDIGINPSDLHCSYRSTVEISPPDIARRRLENWGAIQADTLKVTGRRTFEYGFQARRHLLIAYERANDTKARRLSRACQNRPCASSIAS